MSRTRQNIVSVVLLTALGSTGVGAYKASQIEAPPASLTTVSVDTDEFDAEDFADMNKTPRRLHQWMQEQGADQQRRTR